MEQVKLCVTCFRTQEIQTQFSMGHCCNKIVDRIKKTRSDCFYLLIRLINFMVTDASRSVFTVRLASAKAENEFYTCSLLPGSEGWPR